MIPHLTQGQKDSILEIFNIGVGAAAATLSEMVGEEVQLELPGFDIAERTSIAKEKPGVATVSAIEQEFVSPFGKGRAVLTFPEEKSLVLVEALMGQTSGTGALTNLEKEALTEVGNIILNSSLASLATMLGQEIEVSVPRFQFVEHWAELFADSTVEHDSIVLRLSIQFDLRSRKVDGRLLFLVELNHLLEFVQAVERRLLGVSA